MNLENEYESPKKKPPVHENFTPVMVMSNLISPTKSNIKDLNLNSPTDINMTNLDSPPNRKKPNQSFFSQESYEIDSPTKTLTKYINVPSTIKTHEQIEYLKDFIDEMRFFRRYLRVLDNKQFMSFIEKIEYQYFVPGDYLYQEYSESNYVYFLATGEVGVESKPIHKKYILDFYNWEYTQQKIKKDTKVNNEGKYKQTRDNSLENKLNTKQSVEAKYSEILKNEDYIDLFDTSEVNLMNGKLVKEDSEKSLREKSIIYSDTKLGDLKKKDLKFSNIFIPGATIGYLDLVYNSGYYSESVKAVTNSLVLKINAKDFMRIFEKVIKKMNKMILDLFKDIHFFKLWNQIHYSNLIKHCLIRKLKYQDAVYVPNSSDKNFYFVAKGSVSIYKENKNYNFLKDVIENKVFPNESGVTNNIKYVDKYQFLCKIRDLEMFGYEEGLFVSQKKYLVIVDTPECELQVIPRKKILERIRNKESFEVLKNFFKFREGVIEAAKYNQKKFGDLVYKFNIWDDEFYNSNQENPYLDKLIEFLKKQDSFHPQGESKFNYSFIINTKEQKTKLREQRNNQKFLVLTRKTDNQILSKYNLFNASKRKGTPELRNTKVSIPVSFTTNYGGEIMNRDQSNEINTNIVELDRPPKEKIIPPKISIKSAVRDKNIRNKILIDITENIKKMNDNMMKAKHISVDRSYAKTNDDSHDHQDMKDYLIKMSNRNKTNFNRQTKSIDLNHRINLGMQNTVRNISAEKREEKYKFGTKKLTTEHKQIDGLRCASGLRYNKKLNISITQRDSRVTEPYVDPTTNFRDSGVRTSRGKRVLIQAGQRMFESNRNLKDVSNNNNGMIEISGISSAKPNSYLIRSKFTKKKIDNINLIKKLGGGSLTKILTTNNLYNERDLPKKPQLSKDNSNEKIGFNLDVLNTNWETKMTETLNYEESMQKLNIKAVNIKTEHTNKDFSPMPVESVSPKYKKVVKHLNYEFEKINTNPISARISNKNKNLNIEALKNGTFAVNELNQSMNVEMPGKMSNTLDINKQFLKTKMQMSGILRKDLIKNLKGRYLDSNFDTDRKSRNETSENPKTSTNKTFDKGLTYTNPSKSIGLGHTQISDTPTVNTTARIEKRYPKYLKYDNRKSSKNRIDRYLIELSMEKSSCFNDGIFIDATCVRGSAEYNKKNNIDYDLSRNISRSKPNHQKNLNTYKDKKKSALVQTRKLESYATYEPKVPIIGHLFKKIIK